MEADVESRHPLDALSAGSGVYQFGPFRLDVANRLLKRDGNQIGVSPRAFDCLVLLIERHEQLVTKAELLDAVWKDAFVEESNLAVAISTLRRALGEDPQQRKYIQTVSGRGYRFIGEVKVVPEVSADHSETVQETETIAEPPGAVAETSPEPASSSKTSAHPLRWRSGWLLVAVVVGVASLIVCAWFFILRPLLRPSMHIHSAVVLPITGEGVDESLLLGLTDALTNKIGTVVEVRPTSSVLRYNFSPADSVAVGKEQKVDAVITGTLAKAGDVETLSLNLSRSSDGRSVWKRSYSGTRLSEIELEADAGLKAELSKLTDTAGRPEPDSTRHPVDNSAYQLYLRGRYFWNRRTDEDLQKSIDCFRQSIAIDPNYAPAFAGLADSYALMASFSIESGSRAIADARSAALSAIQLDPTLAEPHASLGMIDFFTDWNAKAAEKEFERAIVLNPNYATAHHWYALDLAAMGRFPEALYEIHRAQALDPLSLIIGTNVGWIEYLNHDYPDAIAAYRRVLELDPSFAQALTRLGIVEIRQGDFGGAVRDLTKAQKLSNDPYIVGLLGQALALDKQTAAAERILNQLSAESKSHYVPPFALALVEMGLGRKEAALVELGRSVDDKSTSMVYAKVDPSLDEFRTDDMFHAVLGRLQF